jgi:hypothetical protein
MRGNLPIFVNERRLRFIAGLKLCIFVEGDFYGRWECFNKKQF